MPTGSPTIRVQIEVKRGERRTFEFTAAQERALTMVAEDGRVPDSVPFATARGLVRKGFLRADGANWYRTPLGVEVAKRIQTKRRSGQ